MGSTRETLPDREDFGALPGYLDEICAWENFGGLNRTDAYAKFCEDPELYQEDFMFMGSVAFSYYLPVIEQYVRESCVAPEDEFEVEAIWVLAHCIRQQFSDPVSAAVLPLRSRVADLVSMVRNNLPRYANAPADQQRVDSAWQELQDRMEQLRDGHGASPIHTRQTDL